MLPAIQSVTVKSAHVKHAPAAPHVIATIVKGLSQTKAPA